jgi:uncharacterized protein
MRYLAEMGKQLHEFRDAVHTFIVVNADERRVIDSRPFQRLRHIHQLALTWLVYPGATHKRFEHCLGVMELAGRVFDVLMREKRRTTGRLPDLFGEIDQRQDRQLYWRQVVRLGALCHDLGHIPFSHGAESLLPAGEHHENLSLAVIRSPQMKEIFESFSPPVRADDVAKVAVGPGKWKDATFSPWEELMSDIVTGDAFGVDRIDYLLRDSIHTGVAYGRFDHHRLLDSLRILWDEEQQKAVIGIERGAIHAAEAMQLARYYMFEQLYYHRVRRALDKHLKEYLRLFLAGTYPTDVEGHLRLTDDHVLAAMQDDADDPGSSRHDLARRILGRHFFRLLYDRRQEDLDINLQAVELFHAAAVEKFGSEHVMRDTNIDPDKPDSTVPKPFRFAVERDDGTVVSSLQVSQILGRLPKAVYDDVFVAPEILEDARRWRDDNLRGILGSGEAG